MPTKSYDRLLIEELRDPELAAEYLSEAVRDGSMEEFLIALRNVAEAHGGLGTLSGETELNRQNLYRMLSENGNPTLANLLAVLDALGIELQFRPRADEAA